MIKAMIKRVTPAPIWDAAHRMRARLREPAATARTYQGVSTVHSTGVLHRGRFAAAFEQHWQHDPWNVETNGDRMRLRCYFICQFAEMAVKGNDFVTVGV
jgi:hypothetical protein